MARSRHLRSAFQILHPQRTCILGWLPRARFWGQHLCPHMLILQAENALPAQSKLEYRTGTFPGLTTEVTRSRTEWEMKKTWAVRIAHKKHTSIQIQVKTALLCLGKYGVLMQNLASKWETTMNLAWASYYNKKGKDVTFTYIYLIILSGILSVTHASE